MLGFRQPINAFALLPAFQPVWAIHQVLVKQVCHSAGKLMNFTLVTVVGEVMLQRGKVRPGEQIRQQPHQFPGHGIFTEGALFRDPRQNPGEHLPDEGCGQWEGDIGCDAKLFRELHLQPLRHTGALHQHHFLLKRVGQWLSGNQRAGQRFQQIQLIGMINPKHGCSLKT
ncbi:hypothetical protein D3C79_447790 [compost metagenome]